MTGLSDWSRPCLVCEERATTEGQLCPECVGKGHRVDDTHVYVNINLTWPGTHKAPADPRASGGKVGGAGSVG